MSEKGEVQSDAGGSGTLLRRVVLTYRLDSDPEEAERTVTLEHTGGGEVIDGLIWSEELMRRLAYLEGGECREPKKATGTSGWKLYSAEREAAPGGPCVWLHDTNCHWWQYCPE